VFTDSKAYPAIGDATSDLVYARFMRADAAIDTGYAAPDLDRFAAMAEAWSRGDEPDDVPRIAGAATQARPRDVYVLFINGAKERAPAAAQGLIARVNRSAE
jgi:uncharacterized protein YecE (DUF72 family)